MANSIDERIVEMQFNNKQFEQGVGSTIGLLDKLKKSLNFEDSVKGFEKLDQAAEKMDLGGIGKSVDVITTKFTAMEVAAISALSHIVTQAVDAGERLVKSFTLDPIMQGFDKYESKVASVQKIMNSSTKNTMETVTAALNKIEWFTNETSYQFDSMVSTLGSFSAAGIELESATKMIIGLANAAAISGVNAKDASHGFIGFQRAIGSGYLSLGIWNSYLKTAGFQSQKFIEGCIRAALEVGTLTGSLEKAVVAGTDMEVTLSNFGETLSKQWVNAKVIERMAENFSVATNDLYDAMQLVDDEGNPIYSTLNEAIEDLGSSLDQYSLKALKAGQETKTWGDVVEYVRGTVSQTWSKTYELLFGNYEVATKFFSTIVEDMYTLFIEANDARNKFLEGWVAAGGRTSFLHGLINSLRIVINLVDRAKQFIAGLIPPVTLQMVLELTQMFEEFTIQIAEALGVEDIVGGAFENVFEGINNGLSNVISGMGELTEATKPVIDTVEALDDLAKAVIRGDYGNGAARIEKLGDAFYKVQNRVNELLGCSFRYSDELVALADQSEGVIDATEGVNDSLGESEQRLERNATLFRNITDTFKGVAAIFQILGNAVSALFRVGQRFIPGVRKVGEAFLGLSGTFGDFMVRLKDFLIENDVFFEAFNSAYEFITGMFNPAIEGAGNVLDDLISRQGSVAGFFESFDFSNFEFPSLPSIFEKFSEMFDISKIKLPDLTQIFSNTIGKIDFSKLQIPDITKVFDVLNTAMGDAIANADEFFSKFNIGFGNLTTFGSAVKPFKLDLSGLWTVVQGIGVGIDLLTNGAITKLVKSISGVNSVLGVLKEYWDTFMGDEVSRNLKQFFIDVKIGEQALFPFFGKYWEANWDFGKKAKTISLMLDELSGKMPVLGKFSEVFSGFSHFITFAIDALKTSLTALGPKVGDLLKPAIDLMAWVVDRIKEIDFTALLRLGTLVGVFGLVFEIIGLISRLGGVMEGLADTFHSLYSLAKSFILKNYAGVLLEIALAVMMIGFVIYRLVEVAQYEEEFTRAAGAVILILIVLGSVVVALGSWTKEATAIKSIQLTASIFLIVAALALVVGMLYYLKDIEWTELLETVGKFMLVAIAVTGVFYAFNYIISIMNQLGKNKHRLPDWKTMVGFFVFVGAIGEAAMIMAKLSEYDFKEIQSGMLAFAEIGVILVGLSYTLNKIKFTGSLGLLVMVGALWLFVKFLDGIKNYDWGEIMTSLLKLIPVFVAIGLLATAASKAGKGALGLAATLFALMFLLDGIVNSIRKLSKTFAEMPVVSSIIAVGVVIGALIGIMAMLDSIAAASAQFAKGSGKEVILTFVGLAAACLAIALAIRIIAGVPWEKAAVAAGALSVTILAFGGACKLAGKFKADFKPLIVMVAAILAVAVSLAALSMLDVNKVLAASIAMGIVFLAIGALMTSMKALSGSKNMSTLKTVGSLLSVLAIIGAIGWSLWNLASLDWKALLAAAGSMSAVILAVGGAMALMKNIKWDSYLKAAGAMGMVILEISVALFLLTESSGDWQKIAASGAALSAIIVAMSGLFAVFALFDKAKSLTTLGQTAHSLAMALPDIAFVILEFTGMLAAFSGLFYLFEHALKFDVLGMMISFLERLAEALGHIISSFGLGLTAELPKIGENIGKFAEGIQPLLETFTTNKTTWETVLTNTLFFLEAIKNLNKASVQHVDENFLNKNIVALANSISEFWKTLSKSGVNIGQAKMAADAISELTAIVPPTVEGDATAWQNLADGMTGLAKAIVAFDEAMGEGDNQINFANVTAGFELIKSLGTIVTDIDMSGFEGWQKLIGIDEEMRLGAMGERSTGSGLQQMATALKQFDNAIKGDWEGKGAIDVGRLTSIFESLKILGEAAQGVPVNYGFLNTIKGNFSWGPLYKGLPELAKGLAAFSLQSMFINTDWLGIGLDAVTKISNAAQGIPLVEPGWLQKFTGDSSLGSFVKELEKLGPAIAKFCESMSGYYATDIGPAMAILRRVVSIPEVFKASGLDLTSNDLEIVGQQLEFFARSFVNMYDVLMSRTGGEGTEDPTASIRALLESIGQIFTEENIQAINDAGTKLSDSLIDGMHSPTAADYMTASIFAWITSLETELTVTNNARLMLIGEIITDTICKAIQDATSLGKIRTASDKLVTEAIIKIRTLYGGEGHGMYGAGQHLIMGLIAGMDSYQQKAIDKANEIAAAINAAFEKIEGIDSPSKVWAKYGEYIVSGLSNGMDDNTDVAITSARTLAAAVNGEFNRTIGSPSVSPVVDLTNAKGSALKLNTMFDANRAAALSASMEINSQVTQINQLVDVTNKILGSIQNGSDLYLDDRVIVGRVNRRLGAV